MEPIWRSWKTTCIGIAVIGLTVALLTKQITLDVYLAAFGALTGIGLAFAKDAAVTGAAPKEVPLPVVIEPEVPEAQAAPKP